METPFYLSVIITSIARNVHALSLNLKNAFAECRFLRELLEILGVRVVIQREVRLERAQLVVFEGRPESLRTRHCTITAVVAVLFSH